MTNDMYDFLYLSLDFTTSVGHTSVECLCAMYGGERSGAESNSCAGRHEGDGPFSAADDEAGGQQQNYHHRGQEDAPLLQANHAEPQGQLRC